MSVTLREARRVRREIEQSAFGLTTLTIAIGLIVCSSYEKKEIQGKNIFSLAILVIILVEEEEEEERKERNDIQQ